MRSRHDEVVVIGGGAAGLFCAARIASRGLRVVMLEHQDHVGKKIRISGGGRCNFTNRQVSTEHYLSANPRFCASALARFTPDDFIALVRAHRIAFHEKRAGQLFCDGSARLIVDMLLAECQESGASIETGCAIEDVSHADGFAVTTPSGTFTARNLIIATGGLSVPRIGATDLGYRVARQFGHRIVEPRPALVPLLWARPERVRYGSLAGMSLPVRVACNGRVFEDDLLFTHRGISGPAILQLSSYWNPGDPVTVDFLPTTTCDSLFHEHRKEAISIGAMLSRLLPRRLVQALIDDAVADTRLTQCARATVERVSQAIAQWTFVPAGTEGYDKAEVTRGGVDTREISSKTMESRIVPGLYFIGEVVDVTGWLGGYNFQWAWSSAHAAAEACALRGG